MDVLQGLYTRMCCIPEQYTSWAGSIDLFIDQVQQTMMASRRAAGIMTLGPFPRGCSKSIHCTSMRCAMLGRLVTTHGHGAHELLM